MRKIRENSWLRDLVTVYNMLGGSANYREVYPLAKQVREARGASWTPAAKGTLRRTVEDHARSSTNFRNLEVFYSVDGHGSGNWALLPEFRTDQKPIVEPVISVSLSKAARRVTSTMLQTVSSADGRTLEKSAKIKNSNLTRSECEKLVIKMYKSQSGICAYSSLSMQLDGEEVDSEMLVSLDRIDSHGNYTPDNVHLVCRFINRWKSADSHELFQRLIGVVKS